MTKPALPLSLAAGLLLSSCAPSITAQTVQGAVQVSAVRGTPYLFAQKVTIEALNDQTPNDRYVTFSGCQGTAVAVNDVRRYGPDVTLQACQKYAQQQADFENTTSAIGLVVGIGLSIGSFLFFNRLSNCGFHFNVQNC